MQNVLSQQALSQSLAIRDLTDPTLGSHAVQQLIEQIQKRLSSYWGCSRQTVRTSPVTSVANNYDRLGYPPDGAAREVRYTRYVTGSHMLRTQTSAAIPDLLSGLSIDPPRDLLLLLPGMVYRRDSIDRLHTGEPHQLDLWRIVDRPMSPDDLTEMIAAAMEAAIPGVPWRLVESAHPYTEDGVQIDAYWHSEWIEVGECGIAARQILAEAGLASHTGLAMGLGLDRLLMIRKNIPDIRLLRSTDERVAVQMLDLEPYKPVSRMPPIKRDLSVCVELSADEETIGDLVRGLSIADCVEAIHVKSETPYEELPPAAHKRMGMKQGQKNVLLEVTIRDLYRTLTDDEANAIRNLIYSELHQGDVHEWATDSR